MLRTPTTPRKKSSFLPGFEALEERTVLNATAIFNAGTITIAGDNKATSVVINDDGNVAANGKVTVLVNGQQALQVDAKTVSAINFQMGKKNDTVQYNLTGVLGNINPTPLAGSTRAITGNLGKSNDAFTASIGPTIAFGGQMNINVQGVNGKDTMTLNDKADLLQGKLSCVFDGGKDNDTLAVNALASNGVGVGSTGVDVIGSQMDVQMLGQKGKDVIAMAYNGFISQGTLNFLADGGKDNDTINAAFTLVPPAPGGVGTPPRTLNATVNGGQGKDNLTLVVVNQDNTPPATISATVNGGTQNDTISTAGSNVLVPITQ